MALTFGFYNSLSEDRKYDARQLSSIFDGIINDGVFMSIGTSLMVTANSGMSVNVGLGRAWFNSTWTLNDAIILLTLDLSDVLLNRIDAVVLEVDTSQAVRANTIKIVKGVAATVPFNPTLTNTEEVHQYPLAYIYVGVGVSEILQAKITNKVGTIDCPFITGILETVDITALVAQWESEWDIWSTDQQQEFIDWFDNINALLGTEPATNLQLQITAIKAPLLSKATPIDADYTLLADSLESNVLKKLTWANVKSTLKTYFDTQYVPGGGSGTQLNSLGVGTSATGTAGEIRATNNITAYYSDERLKNFTGVIENALSKVLRLNGYYFIENEAAKSLGYNNDRVQVGVSAQEVQSVLPEVVTEAPIGGGYLTVWYEKLVPLLIEAIKEQQAEMDEIKAYVKSIEALVK